MVRRPCFAAVHRQTVHNETRTRALKLLATPLEQTPIADLATMTGERHFLTEKATAMGMGLSELLERLWSSDVTELRAAALVSQAQREIGDEIAERKRKQQQRGRRR